MTATWILAGLSGLSLLLFLYPYIVYPQLLRRLSVVPNEPYPCQATVSLIFCAYNEIQCLGEKIENLRELRRNYPQLEILVYDDASSDGTFELLAAAGDVLTVIRGPGRTGKAAGMKRLVQSATGDILVFTDANILLAPDLIERLLPYYGDPNVGGVSCTIKSMIAADSLTSKVGSTYSAIDDQLQMLESRTGNVMGASGGLFSVRRELYPDFPDTVQDDFTVSMSVIFRGKRLVKAPDVLAFEKVVSERHEELRRKIRIGARAYHTHAFLRPQIKRMSRRDRMKYFSRKILRWFGGIFISLSAIFATAAIATVSIGVATFAVAAGVLLLALSIRSRSRLLGSGGELILATFATLVGVTRGMCGQTMATWAPAKSR